MDTSNIWPTQPCVGSVSQAFETNIQIVMEAAGVEKEEWMGD